MLSNSNSGEGSSTDDSRAQTDIKNAASVQSSNETPDLVQDAASSHQQPISSHISTITNPIGFIQQKVSKYAAHYPGAREFTMLTEERERLERYSKIATAIQHSIIKDWIPHHLSSDELNNIRHDTAKRLYNIQHLQASQSKLAPKVDDRLEKVLFMARIDYQVRFYRAFRMNELPNEIIINIFRYVAWSAPNPPARINWRLWLTWTCKHWRKIALDDSTLWSAIWFCDFPPFERSLAWLDRAASTRLDVRIGDITSYKFTGEAMAAVLDKVFVKISSIRMFIVIVEEWEPILVVLDRVRTIGKTSVPIAMERFELHRTGSPYVQIGAGYEPSSFREPIAFFGGAHVPSLHYFSINGIHVNWEQSILMNLTTIDIRRIPLELSPGILQFRTILSNSPALQKLCLDGAGPQLQSSARGLPPIQLLQLKILVIADFSVNYAHYILSHIAAPNVRDLTIMNFGGEDYSPLFILMTARFPQVRLLTVYSVTIVGTAPSGRTVVKWLESMPLLSYLRIANVKKLFLDLFLYDPHSFQHPSQEQSTPRHAICPKLSILECQAMDLDMIADWAISRRNLGAPISKVYLTLALARRTTEQQRKTFTKVAQLLVLDLNGKSADEDALMT